MLPLILSIGLLVTGEPTQLGIGVVDITNIREPSTIVPIYNDSTLTTKVYDFDIYKRPTEIVPFGFHPDYSLCRFVCLEKTPEYYKVLINDSTEGYLKNDGDKQFQAWEAVLLTATFERKTRTDGNHLHSRPSDKSAIIESPANASYKALEVVEVNGENWVFVRVRLSTPPSKANGWMRWKKADKLLIDFLID